MDINYQQQIRATGQYYGYPTCCIDAFIEDMQYLENTGKAPVRARADKYPWTGTGFIPCNEHAESIMQHWDETMQEILKSRVCVYPFPVDESDIDLLEVTQALEAVGDITKK